MMEPKSPERRIAIMVCKKTTEGCTGASCFWAFDTKYKNFEQYKDSGIPVKLWSFFHCNGCESDWDTDVKMQKKLSRLKDDGIEKVHLGVCICNFCPHIDRLCDGFDKAGIVWEKGTH